MESYIYTRHHPSYEEHNVIKIGITDNIPERNSTYLTGEFIQGNFGLVISIPHEHRQFIDNHLKKVLTIYHVQNTGGTEFYQSQSYDMIIPVLDNTGINYSVLSHDEINKLIRKYHECILACNTTDNNENNMTNTPNNIYVIKDIKPDSHQTEVLTNISKFYQHHDIGKIIWSCGLGKTLTSLFIVNVLNCNKICIGVPSSYLLQQFETEILRLFPDKNNILMFNKDSSITLNDVKAKIDSSTKNPVFVLTTYNSCHKLVGNIQFDFKIADEAHHLVGSRMDGKTFIKFHKITATKSLFMTATERVVGDCVNTTEYSMDDENTFGQLIDRKSVGWAIHNKKITNYTLTILKNNTKQVDDIIASCGMNGINNEHKELFLSAYMCLLCLSGKSDKYTGLSHILIYCNKIENAERIDMYITRLLKSAVFDFNDIYHKHTYKNINLKNELALFKQAKKGIISCVYKLGEGVDIKFLNGVVFAENMNSEVRIVQSALRPNRLCADMPDKKAYLIVPYIDDAKNTAVPTYRYNGFDKIRSIIAKLGNVDENFIQRLRLQTVTGISDVDVLTDADGKASVNHINIGDVNDDNELENIKLKLMYAKSLRTEINEHQLEYDYVRSLNRKYGFQCKQDYIQSRDTHENYVENAEVHFKTNVVWKNWYDFLGVDTSVYAPDTLTWKIICKENNIKNLNDYDKKYINDVRLPQSPAELYSNFTNINNELNAYTKRRS
jgi:predicted helicase